MKNIDTNRIVEHGNHVRNNESEILKRYLKEIIHGGVPFCLSALPLSCWEHKKFTTFFSWLQALAKILLQGSPLFERGFVIPEKMDFLTEKQHFISIKKVKYNIWETKDVLSKTFWITFYLSTVSDSAVSSITHIKIQTKNQFIQSKSARYIRHAAFIFRLFGKLDRFSLWQSLRLIFHLERAVFINLTYRNVI